MWASPARGQVSLYSFYSWRNSSPATSTSHPTQNWQVGPGNSWLSEPCRICGSISSLCYMPPTPPWTAVTTKMSPDIAKHPLGAKSIVLKNHWVNQGVRSSGNHRANRALIWLDQGPELRSCQAVFESRPPYSSQPLKKLGGKVNTINHRDQEAKSSRLKC